MAKDIRSNKRNYPVGRRHNYVYWLVQGITDLAERTERVAHYTAEFELTEEEQAGLTSSLAKLDARRAKPRPPSPQRQADTYWSLWGRIKASYARRQQFEENYDAAEGVKCIEDFVAESYKEDQARRTLLELPKRGTPVGGGPDHLWWVGRNGEHRHKEITSDYHAVATLKKLDSNDTYFEEAGT
jgi:hypothetical protein